jgi:2-dehydropantoate 2-reductase
MRIAVVGCGAVGSYYGGQLARAGHEVHFLLRTDYEAVQRQGVRIQSPDGDFEIRPRCARRPEEIGPADLVLIGLKTTANCELPHLLPPLVSPATAVLTLQNGLGNEEAIARLIPVEQIMGGLCFVCLNRLAPGVIRHIGFGQVVLGEFQRPAGPRTHEIATHFSNARVPCTVIENLARAHWEKLVWNIPFNGLGVAGAMGSRSLERLYAEPDPAPTGSRKDQPEPASSAVASHSIPIERPALPCLTTDKLLTDPRWARLVRDLMLEVIAAARALGFVVEESFAEDLIERTRRMGAYQASTLIDFERGQPLELQSLFLEPLRQATQSGAIVPRLAALCSVLAEANGPVAG